MLYDVGSATVWPDLKTNNRLKEKIKFANYPPTSHNILEFTYVWDVRRNHSILRLENFKSYYLRLKLFACLITFWGKLISWDGLSIINKPLISSSDCPAKSFFHEFTMSLFLRLAQSKKLEKAKGGKCMEGRWRRTNFNIEMQQWL